MNHMSLVDTYCRFCFCCCFGSTIAVNKYNLFMFATRFRIVKTSNTARFIKRHFKIVLAIHFSHQYFVCLEHLRNVADGNFFVG